MEFDSYTGSDEDYCIFVTWLVNETADQLRQARGDAQRVREAIATYLRRAYAAHLQTEEVIDFFCVSSGHPLELAGFSEEEERAAVEIFDAIHHDIADSIQ